MSHITSQRRTIGKARAWFPRRRRAMVLLVVLSLLAIFTLITVSFVLVASQARKNATVAARIDQRGGGSSGASQHKSVLHQAMLQLIRGTNNPMSVLQTHSLLEDMYGNDAVTGQIVQYIDTVPPASAGGTGVVFRMRVQIDQLYRPQSGNDVNGNPFDPFGMALRLVRRGYFNGCVITMLDGAMAGRSTRIVETYPVNPNTSPPDGYLLLDVRAFPSGAMLKAEDRFVINGRPFNGTGFGLNFAWPGGAVPTKSGGLLGALLAAPDRDADGYFASAAGPGTNWPLRALLPNPVFGSRQYVTVPPAGDLDFPANYFGPLRRNRSITFDSYVYDPAGPGGADESYDAVDYQNMLMAMHFWDSANGQMRTPLPSLYRPEVINWSYGNMPASLGNVTLTDLFPGKYLSSADYADALANAVQKDSPGGSPNLAVAALMRRQSMRPSPIDHPNFPGNQYTRNASASPIFHPVFGYGTSVTDPDWDVDNDSDGRRDSVWVDLGFPAQATADGRWFKPMFAVLCVDMDGRLNLNAHGNPNHVVTSPYFDSGSTLTVDGPFAGASGALSVAANQQFHFGQGYGPAEINLRDVLPITATGDPLLQLYGGLNGVEGRYGEVQSSTRGQQTFFRAGLSNDYMASNQDKERPSRLAIQNYGQSDVPLSFLDILTATTTINPFGAFSLPDNFGTPQDLDGDGVIGLDFRGQPYYASIPTVYRIGPHGFGEPSEVFNDPYELNLANTSDRRWVFQPSDASSPPVTPIDAPFTPDELERLLRRYDADADYVDTSGSTNTTMPSRLAYLAPSLVDQSDPASASRFSLFTTESSDVPASIANATVDSLIPLSGAPIRAQGLTIQDVLAARLKAENPSYAEADVNLAMTNLISGLLSPDLAAGLKFDLNRPFGNGRDDNGNGLADEPGEAMDEKTTYPSKVMTRPLPTFPSDLNNDGTVDLKDKFARYHYARHLYVLMMLTLDERFRQNQAGWTTTAGSVDPKEVARRVAQWAVNVVDFRDRDSIMTGFEFDLEPFKDNSLTADGQTWDVDGDLSFNPFELPIREVKWGCERPELLMTEAIATHDRRTEDTTFFSGYKDIPGDPNNDDPHFDQTRRPVGTLVVELYNPWSPFDAPSAELHSSDVELGAPTPRNGYGVDLTAISGPGFNPGVQPTPVWRIVTRKMTAEAGDIPRNVTDSNPNLNDPKNYSPQLAEALKMGSVAYFTASSQPGVKSPNLPNPSVTDPNAELLLPVFHREPNFATRAIRPGDYAIVAPAGPVGPTGDPVDPLGATSRYRTFFGQRTGAAKENNYPFYLHFENGHVDPRRAGSPAPNPSGPTYSQEFPLPASQLPVGFVMAMTPRPGNRLLRFSISEPDNGYPIPGPGKQPFPTHPDDFFASGQEDDIPYDEAYQTNANVKNVIAEEGYLKPNGNTQPHGSSMIYLERLADPTQPWHRYTNPYMTIDLMYVGLRSYNGEPNPTHPNAQVEKFGVFGNFAPDTAAFDTFRRGSSRANYIDNLRFRTTQPVASNDKLGAQRNIWSPLGVPLDIRWCDGDASQPDETGLGSISTPNRKATLGYMNGFDPAAPTNVNEFGPGFAAAEAPFISAPDRQFSFVGTPKVGDTTVAPPTSPTMTFPWLTWNNRPFANAAELLLVPCTSQPGLLLEHSVANSGATFDPYDPQKTADSTNDQWAAFQGPFRHLLNFFASTSLKGNRGDFAEFSRLLDFVEVPSRFAGANDVLDPGEFINGGNDHLLHPPYNKLSRYREPGRINLNTIFDKRVWDALTDGVFPATAGSADKWQEVVHSRSRLPNTPTSPLPPDWYMMDKGSPTLFRNPFRSAASNPLVPLAGNAHLQARDVDVTLFRPILPAGLKPLFEINNSIGAHNDPDRNPYFRYAGLQKIYNSVTTRSNVYAMWVTVGYFEVTPNPGGPDSGHPDGWQLGAEMGTDTGEIERHRAFYLYDRTIPVGFQRGETLNVEDGLLIQRYIE